MKNVGQFLTRNFNDKIFGNILKIWFMHCDTAGGGERVDNAVHTIHCERLAISFSTLQREHDLRQCRGQATPLQDDARQRMKGSKFLKDVFCCTPDRLCTTKEASQHTKYSHAGEIF